MSDVPTPPRPAAVFTCYAYSSSQGYPYALPGKTPEEAWENCCAMVRDSYDPASPNCIGGGLAEFYGYEPSAEEVEADMLEDISGYTTLLTIQAPSEAEAFAWWSRDAGDARGSLREDWREVFDGGDEARH